MRGGAHAASISVVIYRLCSISEGGQLFPLLSVRLGSDTDQGKSVSLVPGGSSLLPHVCRNVALLWVCGGKSGCWYFTRLVAKHN